MDRRPGLSCRAERQRIAVGLIGGAAVKGCVRSSCVVEGEMTTDRSLCFADAVIGMQINFLVLDGSPKAGEAHRIDDGAVHVDRPAFLAGAPRKANDEMIAGRRDQSRWIFRCLEVGYPRPTYGKAKLMPGSREAANNRLLSTKPLSALPISKRSQSPRRFRTASTTGACLASPPGCMATCSLREEIRGLTLHVERQLLQPVLGRPGFRQTRGGLATSRGLVLCKMYPADIF